MRTFSRLTVANVRTYTRDRAGLFWTLLFPLVFMVLFGLIFSGGGGRTRVAWVDGDASQQAAELRTGLGRFFEFTEYADADAALVAMRGGDVRAVIVVPPGYGAALAAAKPGIPAGVALTVYTDPSQATTSQQIVALTAQAVSVPLVQLEARTIQTTQIGPVAYIVPSILAMALMQLGLFGSLPLVEQRQQGILKRLAATPLPRSTLVGSNLVYRLGIGVVQAVVILVVAQVLFGIAILDSPLLVVLLVLLGAVTFISLGYVVASFARTEDTASQVVSLLQFPLMFLSGIFFPIDQLPDFLRAVAALIPLTYLGDALRQVMVGGVPFAPLGVDVAVLGVWTVVCFGISARFFRWE